MQREIMTSIPFLSQPSTEALNTPEDLAVAQDLKDTLDAHRNGCVGMAANMIGVSKRIIAFVDEDFGGRIFVMFNPTITAQDGAYDAPEGCLSLKGERRTVRFHLGHLGIQIVNELCDTGRFFNRLKMVRSHLGFLSDCTGRIPRGRYRKLGFPRCCANFSTLTLSLTVSFVKGNR